MDLTGQINSSVYLPGTFDVTSMVTKTTYDTWAADPKDNKGISNN
jgi:hypothetical protein